MTEGLVSVIMGVHDEQEEYLRAAFESICHQTYPDVEFIIIDDASDGNCKAMLEVLCKDKQNVRLVHNKENLGLTKSLNIGLHLADGEFIARMDADDISVRNRIEKQVWFLKKHKKINIVGTGVVSFGSENVFMSPAFGYNNDEAQCNLFFSSTLCHPSVMLRKSFLEKNNLTYDETVKKGQDYDLWERASVYGQLAVMSEVLLFYRTHSAQITSTNKEDQNRSAEIIHKRRLHRIGIEVSEKEYQCHQLLASGTSNAITATDVSEWVHKIILHNEQTHFVNSRELRKNLNERLTLYKLRNHYGVLSYNFSEIKVILKTLLNRVGMTIKIWNTNIMIQKVISQYEK